MFLYAKDAAACLVSGCDTCLCFLPASDIWRWKMSVQRLEVPPSWAELSQCFRFRLICRHDCSYQPAVSSLNSNIIRSQSIWHWEKIMQPSLVLSAKLCSWRRYPLQSLLRHCIGLLMPPRHTVSKHPCRC